MRAWLFYFLTAVVALQMPAAFSAVNLSHGYAHFSQLKYSPSFTHFDWVNPQAPKGGTLKIMALGGFDSLNPYVLKGTSPINTSDFYQYGISELNAPLMVGQGVFDPSGDEPASSYGLVAESIQYSDDLSWVVFNLRKKATFHDGQPITAADVEFSYRSLLEHGHPQYRNYLSEVERVEILGKHKVRFIFKRANNSQLLLNLGDLPVLPKHYWQNRTFAQTSLEPPLGSGPYRISQVKPGHSLTFTRVKNWWGKNLPVNRGKYNFDQVQVEFYRDRHVAFEAFKAGHFDIYIDHQAKNWANNYRFPSIDSGDIIRAEVPHQLPIPTQAIFINTRRPPFDNAQVREALSLLFDFEWANKALFYGAYQRTESYFPNSPYAAKGIPEGAEWLLLAKWREHLPQELFSQPFLAPRTDGRGLPRENISKALKLLQKAGWKLTAQGLRNKNGQKMQLEILLVNPSLERIFQAYVQNLQNFGIDARMRTVDRAQYKQRIDNFDFDLTLLVLSQSLIPGQEQWYYFHSSQAYLKGSKNYAGINNPIVDDLLDAVLSAPNQHELTAAMQALDRVLLWQHYIIPNWYISHHRIAFRNKFNFVRTPPYTLGIRSWWYKPAEAH